MRDMEDFFVLLNRERIKIDKRVLCALFELATHVMEKSGYEAALKKNRISFSELKKLAVQAGIPYPLFFAPYEKVEKQIQDYKKNIEEKIPTKHEIALGNRGNLEVKEVESIIRDLARKQEFLKRYVLPHSPENAYTGSLQKQIKGGVADTVIAEGFREFFNLDLGTIRKMNKERALAHIARSFESRGVFISFSSYNYMPQNIDRSAGFSGLCVKDKKFPYVFINTRDGDERPIILETFGRQIFTAVSMLVCIGMNIFAINIKKNNANKAPYRKIYSIAEEILIPVADVKDITVESVDDLKKYSGIFKVTPSMLLVRLEHLDLISKVNARYCRAELADELSKKEASPKHSVRPENGYRKYNGERFSREVLSAYRARKISFEQTKNILFRKGKKMVAGLFKDYSSLFI